MRVGVAGGPGTASRLRIAAAVYLSRAAQQGRRLLCRVRAEHLVTPTARATEVGPVGLVGAISFAWWRSCAPRAVRFA
jgi:hypothetical protein